MRKGFKTDFASIPRPVVGCSTRPGPTASRVSCTTRCGGSRSATTASRRGSTRGTPTASFAGPCGSRGPRPSPVGSCGSPCGPQPSRPAASVQRSVATGQGRPGDGDGRRRGHLRRRADHRRLHRPGLLLVHRLGGGGAVAPVRAGDREGHEPSLAQGERRERPDDPPKEYLLVIPKEVRGARRSPACSARRTTRSCRTRRSTPCRPKRWRRRTDTTPTRARAGGRRPRSRARSDPPANRRRSPSGGR